VAVAKIKPQLWLGLRGGLPVGSFAPFTSSSSSNSDNIIIMTGQQADELPQLSVKVTAGRGDTSTATDQEVEIPHAAAAVPAVDAAAGVVFGLLQLLVTGCVLALLGGCHSSCETLIYTVLTDLVEAAGNQQHKDSIAVIAANGGSRTHCGDAVCGHHGSSCCCSSEQCSTPVLLVPAGKCCVGGSANNAAAAEEAHMHACACSVQGISRCDVSNGAGSTSDSTEVVMVLYVLFWVVGFTVGAGGAGLPGSSVLGQQLTGLVMGLVLAWSAFWAWRTAAAAFGRISLPVA
jgi:hypothetical protein